MFDSYPDVIRPTQLRQMLGIGRTKAYQLIREGVIPSRKIGGNYFIRKVDVVNFINKNS